MAQATSGNDRQVIRIQDEVGLLRDPKTVHDEAVRALNHKNKPERLFHQGHLIVRAVRSLEHGCVTQVLDDKMVEAELLDCAIFIRQDRRGRPEPVSPPKATLRTILGQAAVDLPELRGIVHSPLMRPDGSILIRPGYDRDSKLIYVQQPGFSLPAIPQTPSSGDAAQALEVLSVVFSQFPFANEASRTNAIAHLLTPYLRLLIQAPRPIAIVNARQASSGKTLLVDAVARIATGRPATATQFAKEEELEKKVSSLLVRGVPFINFDNVKRQVESPVLESILTAQRHSDRTFGFNDRGFDVPQDAVWSMTGNNLHLGTEMSRRSYPIDLDPKHPHPEDRKGPRDGEVFRNLTVWIAENRGPLECAVLTMCRAWCVGGRPKPDMVPFGSFETWQEVVGGVLVNAGAKDFLANRDHFRLAHDLERQQIEAFLRVLLQVLGSAEKTFTARNVAAVLESERRLSDVQPDELSNFDGEPQKKRAQRIGLLLRKIEGRQFAADGLRVVSAGQDSHDKVNRYRVVTNA